MSFTKIIDLTHPFSPDCPGAPGLPKPEIALEYNLSDDGFNMERLNSLVHTGTHIDAPFHFIDNGKKLHEIDLSKLHGKAVVIDLRYKKAEEEITRQELEQYDDKMDGSCIVILVTGWGGKRGFSDEYIYHQPYLGKEGAGYLVSKGIKGVCIDHFSISGVEKKRATQIHKELLGHDVWIAEDIYIPEGIFKDNWHIIALPMLLKGASGGPLRIIAVR